MFGILAVVMLGVVGSLALLTWLNERSLARTLAPYLASPKAETPELPNLPAIFYGGAVGAVARPGGAVGHSTAIAGHSMRQYRSETTALAPVQWRADGELLPAVVRIGGRPQPETPATAETRTPQRVPSFEADVTVPGAQAALTALAVGIGAGLLSWALSWSWRVPVVVVGLALAAGWLWRLGVVDALLWTVESFTGQDLDNDQHVGRPAHAFTLANPATARQVVAQEGRAAAQTEAQAELSRFLDACFMLGTAEGKHGVTAAGPGRVAYLAKRDVLLNLGVAKWRNPERPTAGWELACSRQRAQGVLAKHVL